MDREFGDEFLEIDAQQFGLFNSLVRKVLQVTFTVGIVVDTKSNMLRLTGVEP